MCCVAETDISSCRCWRMLCRNIQAWRANSPSPPSTPCWRLCWIISVCTTVNRLLLHPPHRLCLPSRHHHYRSVLSLLQKRFKPKSPWQWHSQNLPSIRSDTATRASSNASHQHAPASALCDAAAYCDSIRKSWGWQLPVHNLSNVRTVESNGVDRVCQVSQMFHVLWATTSVSSAWPCVA